MILTNVKCNLSITQDNALPNAIHAFGGPASVAADSRAYIDAYGLFQDAGALDYAPGQYFPGFRFI